LGLSIAAEREIPKLQIARAVGTGADVAAAVSASLAYFVVMRITDAQRRKQARTRDLAPQTQDAPEPVAVVGTG
jgi:hypothetical protein